MENLCLYTSSYFVLDYLALSHFFLFLELIAHFHFYGSGHHAQLGLMLVYYNLFIQDSALAGCLRNYYN